MYPKTRLGLSLLLFSSFAGPALARLSPVPVASGVPSCEADSWCHLSRWVASDGGAFDNFGEVVELDGDTAFVSAPNHDAVYVFTFDGGTWSESQVLTDPNGGGDGFGESLDADGDLLVVGSPRDDTAGIDSGAVHVYERTAGVWNFSETLVDDTPTPGGYFGSVVGLSGVWLGVGAPEDGGTGHVHVFLHTFIEWVLLIEMQPAGADAFGSALSIVEVPGDLAVQVFVGDPDDDVEGPDAGAVYYYYVTPGAIASQVPLRPAQIDGGDHFGYTLAFDGEHLAVAAPGDDTLGHEAGKVYVFEVPDLVFPSITLDEELLPCVGGASTGFGLGLDMANGRLAVGAQAEGDGGAVRTGRAYVFTDAAFGFGWNMTQRIAPADGVHSDDFGGGVAIDEKGVLVGSPWSDPAGSGSGSAYFVSLASSGGGQCPCDGLADKELFGAGKPGSIGVPVLDAISAPVAGKLTTVRLSNALPGTAPILAWGLIPTSLPFDDGEWLIADPTFALLPVVGVLEQVGIGWNVPPNPAFCGLDVYMQALFLDPGAGGGLHTAQSNGLRMTVGY